MAKNIEFGNEAKQGILTGIEKLISDDILEGGGFTGAFKDFYGFCSYDKIEINIENQMKRGRDLEYIMNNIEGGVDYNSTDVYVNELIRIVGT